MAGWGKQLTAEEILGMKPDELKTKLDGSASKDDVTKLNTAIETQASTLSEIQKALQKLTAPPPAEPDPQVTADANDPTTQILTDPHGFINRQTASIQATALQTQAQLNELQARDKYGAVFQKYGQDLSAKAQNFSIAQRAQPGFWDFHIRSIVGEKVLNGDIDAGTYPSLMGSSSVSPNMGNEPNDPNKGFSSDMATFFKERGVPLEKAARIKDLMHRDGEPINLENYRGVKVGHA